MNYKNEKEFESVPDDTLTAGIQIRDLKKAYIIDWFCKTTVQALDGISIDFYKGQITALLGHNGAGKTTMMSILTGLTSSTGGMVLINGKNISSELEAVRSNLGLCPQENIVFPELTVFEQILFFGMVRNFLMLATLNSLVFKCFVLFSSKPREKRDASWRTKSTYCWRR